MKRKWLHLISCAATGLACAAVLIGTPDPNSPTPGNGENIPGIENQENGEGQNENPGAETQDDKDPLFDKHK